MATTDTMRDALSEMDRFVRLMAVAPGPSGVVAVVRAYLASWPKERIRRLQATDAGWAPFDEYQRPYPVSGIGDVRQLGGSVRIRCRDLRVSDMRVAPELLELDLFFYFANESLAVHEPISSRAPNRCAPRQQAGLRQSGYRGHEHRV